jgi:hypothetical protein
VDQYQCKVLVKNALGSQTIPLLNRIVETLHGSCQIICGHVHILAPAIAAGSTLRDATRKRHVLAAQPHSRRIDGALPFVISALWEPALRTGN